MNLPTEAAYYPEEDARVIVLARGPHVSNVSWTASPGITYNVWVENEELIFDEDDVEDGM